jgi:hypothetical protein
MAVRSELLAAGRRTDATLAVVYSTPDGDTTILKRVNLFNLSTSATIDVLVALDAGAFNQTPFWEGQLAPRARLDLDCWVVLPPFAEIAIRGDVDGGCNYWFSGAELAGVSG